MTCAHAKYTGDHYKPVGEAMRDKEICWTGMIVNECDKCGADISSLRIVQVKTVKEVLNEE